MLVKKDIITGAETWVYGYDVETKAQSSQWVSATSSTHQKSTGSLVQCESDTVFFDCEGIIHQEFLLRDWIVNKEYYLKDDESERGSGEKKV
jgi:hypothetical protein